MAEEKKCLTFIWKIKNFSFSYNASQIYSPTFFSQEMGDTEWKISMYTNSYKFLGFVACYLQRGHDSGPKRFQLDYELSFLADDGSVIFSEIFRKKVFVKSSTVWDALRARRDVVFSKNKDLFMPNDTLVIRCRMWNNKESFSKSRMYFGETVIETEQRNSIGTIENFSNAEADFNTYLYLKPSMKSFLSSTQLTVLPDGKLGIEIKPLDSSHESTYRCKIFIHDILGNKVKSGQDNFHDEDTHCIPLTLPKEHLIENRDHYLPNDVLTLEFEITFPTGEITEKSGDTDFGNSCQDTQTICNLPKTNFSLKEQNTENLTTLKDDLISLFKEDILCDTKLKTATETFPAHTVVLSARSSIFRSMFTTDMKEKTNNCVDIDDLDADTVRRMLSFMYLDSLDDLEYESTKSLYYAADKYNIVSLRIRCSNILKQNLLNMNCCEVLLLADEHQDVDLKNAVQDYIAKNSEKVLFSEEWKNLEKNHPQLGLEVFHHIYTKNRRIKNHNLLLDCVCSRRHAF